MKLQNRKLKSNNNSFMNKGFTLIELLAVIIIMGIIALITIPVIKDLIDESRKNSFKNSALGIISAANQYYLNSKLNGENFEELIFTAQEGKMISGDKELSFNGKAPIGSSYVKINKKGEVAMNITDGEFYASKDYDEVGVLVTGDESSALTREELASRITELETLLNTKIAELNSKVDSTKEELNTKVDSENNKLQSDISTVTSSLNNYLQISDLENREIRFLDVADYGYKVDLKVDTWEYYNARDYDATPIEMKRKPSSLRGAISAAFKRSSTLGISSAPSYCPLITVDPYGSPTDFSGGEVIQYALCNDKIYVRYSNGQDSWNEWISK